uniref:Chitin-binding type-2 domain-containing protein n=1 Tax=Anopheles dirus TaxID=7168 RepID=A0A182NHQ2_9DIPT
MVRILPLVAVMLTVAVLANARTLPNRSKQVKVYSYVLPAGAEEIRDDINHSFACGNRTDGFYVDIDNDCQIFHRCQDHARFSFICAERTVFSQMYQTCVHDGQLGYPCEDSVQYYPEGESYEPSAPNSESAGEDSEQPDQQAVPSEELEAPQAPSKAVEVVGSGENTATSPVASAHDMVQPSEPASEAHEEMKDEPEQEENRHDQHQLNADLFDPIEEESDAPAENSAQEVMDDAEPTPAVVPAEVASSDTTTPEEESNEVEVIDDATQQEPIVPSETVPSDVTPQDDVEKLEQPEVAAMNVLGTPTDADVPEAPTMDNETPYEGDSLLNAVQMVEELEPIVHDLAVETDELKPLVAEMAQDAAPSPTPDEPSPQDNEVLPEADTDTADMEARPSSDSEQSTTVVESEQQVNDPALSADDSSETVEADETAQPASEPEAADVKPDDLPAEQQPLAADAPERPLESPAIVEEMAPQRPNDSAELPELIVSTEFHLDAATQGPPIRRRKTFLFRADAIRSRQ